MTTYKDAGVNIQRAEDFVENLQQLIQAIPTRVETVHSSSGYGACFSIPLGYHQPVIVTTTDGVGTKVKLATQVEDIETALFNIGIDVVAMCVNDLICEGAEPIHFLDYYATSELDVEQATWLIKGIIRGCELAGCELAGGETAEMPGLYNYEEFDIAGFAVGVAENFRRLNKENVQPNDVVIGLFSNGIHSNGFSLVRKIIEMADISLTDEYQNGTTFEQEFLKSTTIYVQEVLYILKKYGPLIKGIAHITGGGLYGNIPRIIPDNVQVILDQHKWEWPSIFNWIKTEGEISLRDMYETFNCGIGMVLIVDPECADQILQVLSNATIIGQVIERPSTDPREMVIQNASKYYSDVIG